MTENTRNTYVLLVFLALFYFSQSQSLSNNSHPIPAQLDTFQVTFAKTEWFGKLRFEIRDFGSGYCKEGISTSDVTRYRNYDSNITRKKISVSLKTKNGIRLNSNGKYYKAARYNTKNDWLLEFFTNIESEVSENLDRTKAINATLSLPGDTSDWNLRFEQSDIKEYMDLISSVLISEARVIHIIQSYSPNPVNEHLVYPTNHYLFMENEKVLGFVNFSTKNEIYLEKTLDESTRLLLLLTAFTLAF